MEDEYTLTKTELEALNNLAEELLTPIPIEDPVAHEIAAGRPPRRLKPV
jgi:hypothetical protein